MNIQQRRAPPLEQIPVHRAWGRGHGPNVKPSYEDQGIMVSHEWQGYRHVMEILHPFGYSESFVSQVLQQVKQMYHLEGPTTSTTSMPMEQSPDQDITHTTIAVRGATIARPEGYCLCWEYPKTLVLATGTTTSPASQQHQKLQQQIEWSRSTSSSNHSRDQNNLVLQTIKWQERQRKVKLWKAWRRQLQVTVLPQVLVRKPPTSNGVVQFLNVDEKHAVRLLTPPFQCGPIGEPVTIIIVGIATEDGCFCSGLNHRFEVGHLYPNNPVAELAELSPVCMATDAWECATQKSTSQRQQQQQQQPHRTPLEQHLFQDEDDDSEAESDDVDDEEDGDDYDSEEDSSSNFVGGGSRSVSKKNSWLHQCTCIFQDNSDLFHLSVADEATANDAKTVKAPSMPPPTTATQESNEDDDGGDANGDKVSTEREDSQTARLFDDDDDDDDDDEHQEDNKENDATADSDEDADAERILRGSRIPGLWHCYTAVFDGKESMLRVDGVQEVLTSAKPKGRSNKASENGSAKKQDTSRHRSGPRAMLDGLTIGSDHCFDMTLCFGQGSGGEGEGAIAEIAVFSGRLDTQDLEVLERQLMTKHGIPTPCLTREALVREDDYTRKSHALYCQFPPEPSSSHLRQNLGQALSFEHESIPLRIMTKHRSVAWHQFNAVTGEELRIKRIGSRSAGSSSDW